MLKMKIALFDENELIQLKHCVFRLFATQMLELQFFRIIKLPSQLKNTTLKRFLIREPRKEIEFVKCCQLQNKNPSACRT